MKSAIQVISIILYTEYSVIGIAFAAITQGAESMEPEIPVPSKELNYYCYYYFFFLLLSL